MRLGARPAASAAGKEAKPQKAKTDWDVEWANVTKLMDDGTTVTVKVEVSACTLLQRLRASVHLALPLPLFLLLRAAVASGSSQRGARRG